MVFVWLWRSLRPVSKSIAQISNRAEDPDTRARSDRKFESLRLAIKDDERLFTVKVKCCALGVVDDVNNGAKSHHLLCKIYPRAGRASTHFALDFHYADDNQPYAFTLERIDAAMRYHDVQGDGPTFLPTPTKEVPKLPPIKFSDIVAFYNKHRGRPYNLFTTNCKHFVVEFWFHMLGFPWKEQLPRPSREMKAIVESVEDQWYDMQRKLASKNDARS